MKWLRQKNIKKCTATLFAGWLSINFGDCVAADPVELFESLDKYRDQSVYDDQIDILVRRTTEPPRSFVLAKDISNSTIQQIARSVGRLDILYVDQKGDWVEPSTCTATLLASNLLITNYHCVPGPAPNRAAKVNLAMDYDGFGSSPDHRFAINPQPLDSSDTLDFALLRPVDPIPSDFGHVPLTFRDPIAGETLIVVSHPLAQGKRISNRGCIVSDIQSYRVYHGCPTMKGSSGALLFSFTDRAIVGIHVAGGDSDHGVFISYNKAANVVNVHDNSPMLQKLLVKAPAPTKVHNSGIILSESELESEIRLALRKEDNPNRLDSLLKEVYKERFVINGTPLIQLAVEEGAVNTLSRLLAKGLPVNNDKGAELVDLALRKMDQSRPEGAKLLALLLDSNAPLLESPRSGLKPYCEGGHSSDVYTFFKTRLNVNELPCY